MLEILLEYILCVIDYTMLLYFFLMLIGERWNRKKAISSIILISILQMIKDYSLDFGGWSIFVDCFIVVIYLFLNSSNFNYLSLLCAMLIYSIFKCCIVMFVGSAALLSIDVDTVLIFGWERYLFSVVLKLFILCMYLIFIQPLKVLKGILSEKIMSIMFIMISLILTTISYIYGNAVNNESILFYVIFTLLIFICILYLIYHYCVVLKENENLNLIQHTVELTAQYAKDLEDEYELIRKMRHDMKNQLYVLSDLQRDQRFEESNEIVSSLIQELNTKRSSISGNVFVDAVIRQKQKQYENIQFDLSICLKKEINMEAKDIISLLSNIIDNACEELIRLGGTSFKLTMRGGKTGLDIIEENKCRKNLDLKTDKNKRYHGYGLRIISEIVEKYNGKMMIDKDDAFCLKIMLIYQNSTLTV